MKNKFGLKPETINKIQAVLSAFPEIEEALIYGSRAKGNYKNGSDIDLSLKTLKHFEKQSSNSPLSLTKISLALDELDLPYTFDLSFYENINNADLVTHIDRVGVCFYKKAH